MSEFQDDLHGPKLSLFLTALQIESHLPGFSFGDLGTGKSVVSVHLSSVFRLRFGLAAGVPSPGKPTNSELGSLAAALVLPADLGAFLLGFLVVAVTGLPAGLVGLSLGSFLVAARVLPAGLSDISSTLITAPAFPVTLMDFFFVSFLIAAVLHTDFFKGGFLATPADFFSVLVDFL